MDRILREQLQIRMEDCLERGDHTGLRVPEDGQPIEGYLPVENEGVPVIPEAQEGFRPSLYYVDGVLEWRMEAEPTLDEEADSKAQETEVQAQQVKEEDEIF